MQLININTEDRINIFESDKHYYNTEWLEVPQELENKLVKVINGAIVEDINAEKTVLILQSKTERDKAINEITNAKLLDDLQLDGGQITQSIYDTRKNARLAQLAEVLSTFYTTTGLSRPINITA